MSEIDDKKRQQLVARFRTIARERLDRMNNAFVELEKNPANDAASVLVMREIHTLKGEARLMGFVDVNLVAHRTEDLLVKAKGAGFRQDASLNSAILQGFDVIAFLLDKQAGQGKAGMDLREFLETVSRLLNETASGPSPTLQAAAPAAPAAPPPPTSTVSPPAEPAAAPSAPAGQPRAPGAPAAGPPPLAEQETEEVAERSSTLLDLRAESTIRVNTSRLDALTYLAGEMMHRQLLTERMLLELSQTIDRARRAIQGIGASSLTEEGGAEQLAQAGPPLREKLAAVAALHDACSKSLLATRNEVLVSRDCLGELENTLRELRLLPLSSLWGRYPRAVRDLAVEQHKEVQLSMSGGEIELDKQVLDLIGEPLLHLVRNAVDHGIEAPEERKHKNKPAGGTIAFSARQYGTHVEIVVEDDGRGLDLDGIRRTAVTRGIWTAEQAAACSDAELSRLVCQAGFSTRSKVSDISGRGIGLDVVKDRIEGLGGSVRMESQPGQGLQVVLSVPISVALMRALVMDVGPEQTAIPSQAVVTVAEVTRDNLIPAGNGVAMRVGDSFVDLHDLPTLLGLAPSSPAFEPGDRIVIVQFRGRSLGLRVKRVIGELDVVQRSLDRFLEGMRLFMGAAILEHSQPLLILNVAELVRLADGEAGPAPVRAPARQGSVLLVEDSELTRDMIQEILAGSGLRVIEAANGQEALRRIQSQRPDLVVTDIEMPIMDGYELIRELRQASATKDLPIVVLTSLDSTEQKQRAAALGADAYLVKKTFRKEALLETVLRFLGARNS